MGEDHESALELFGGTADPGVDERVQMVLSRDQVRRLKHIFSI